MSCSLSCSRSHSVFSCSCSCSHNEPMTCSWAIRGLQWRPGSQSLEIMVPEVSPSWSEGYKPGYVAVCSQRSKRAACNNIQREDSMQMTTRSKMWLLSACCLICRCRGGGRWWKAVRKFLVWVATWACTARSHC